MTRTLPASAKSIVKRFFARERRLQRNLWRYWFWVAVLGAFYFGLRIGGSP